MKLDNHIANRFLTDPKFKTELISEHIKRHNTTEAVTIIILNNLLSTEYNRTYYVTNTVLDSLQLFDTKKAMTAEGWRIFEHLGEGKIFKKTFIFPNNQVVRAYIEDGFIHLMSLKYTLDPGSKSFGYANWTIFWVNFADNIISSNVGDEDTNLMAPIIFSLLCFTELTDNEEIILPPNGRYGTQKSGKLINTLKENITIINSRWNTKVILSTPFNVRGHLAIRWTGTGRTVPKLVFIEPFSKTGYTRSPGKEKDIKI